MYLCLSSPMLSIIFQGSREIFHVFSVVFQASTGKKLLGTKIKEIIMGPVNLMLNILLKYVLDTFFTPICIHNLHE